MSMTLPEAKVEAKGLLEKVDEIERRYPDGPIDNNEDEAEVKRLLTEYDELIGKIDGLEMREERKRYVSQERERFMRPANAHKFNFHGENDPQMSPGDQFIRSDEYRHMAKSGAFQGNLRRNEFAVNMKDGTSLVAWQKALEGKALVYSGTGVGGPLTINDVQPGVINILQREINVLDIIPRYQTESDIVEYVTESTFTNNAAMTAEATASTGTSGAKPESVLAYATNTSAVRTLAHWLPVTNKMLADAPAIRGIINQRLLLGLTLALETQILTGDGTGENFTGILNAGINVQALGTDNSMDALFKGRTLVRTTGHARPSAYVLNPANWQTIRLARENATTGTLGGYLMGPPSMAGAPTLWGLPVIESEAETSGTGLVGDFDQGCGLFDREQAAIRVGLINDQFTRNMQTILAELRAAFMVWRPTAFTRVTGIT